MSTHQPAQRAQPSRQTIENDALVQWLGGLQGWRTAVRDAARNSALKESHDPRKETSYLDRTKIGARDEAKGEGR